MADHALSTPDRRTPTLAAIDGRRCTFAKVGEMPTFLDRAGVGETPTPSSPAGGVANRHPGGGVSPSPLSRRLFFSLAATLPIAVTVTTAAQANSFAPTLLATYPAQQVPDWQAAQAQAQHLHNEARVARDALEARIGPRGLSLGTLTLPNGRTVPIQAASPDQAKKMLRRFYMDLKERQDVVAAVREACDRWDAEAERAGVRELERKASAARERAKALMANAARIA